MRVQGNLKSLSMFVVVVGITLALGVYAPAARADAIVIDTFAAPAAEVNFFSFDAALFPSLVGKQPDTVFVGGSASILGGERELTVEVGGAPSWMSASGLIGGAGEVLSVATWGAPGSKVILDYAGLSADDLTDGGENNAIALNFNFLAGNDLHVKMTVVGDGGTAIFDSATSTLGNVAQLGSSFSYDAPFDEFVIDTGDPLGNADTINIVLNDPGGVPLANVNFELTSVTAVPEPSTLAMLLMVGVASLLAVARRRQER